MFSRWLILLLALAIALHPCAVLAVNSVVVGSKSVSPGETGVSIAIRLTNDIAISAVQVPLAIREISSGSFITSLQMSYSERLTPPSVLDMSVRNQYASEDGTCNPGPHVGFATLTYSDGAAHPVLAPPEGALIVRVRQLGTNLNPGTDVTGSMILTVNVSKSPGSFEVDSTCTNPSNHLAFVNAATSDVFTPTFTKGVVVIRQAQVVNLNDAGFGSLRDAIEVANGDAGCDTITFAVAGTINLLTPLPWIADHSGPTLIAGFTAPGAVYPFTPTVVINGSSATPGTGLIVESDNNWIAGLTFRNFNGAGIAVGDTSWPVFNSIAMCRFYRNTGPGIDLGNDGITANDPGDLDPGPNSLHNYPVFDSVRETGPDTFSIFGTTAPYSWVMLYLAAEAGNPHYQPEGTTHGPAYLLLASTFAGANGAFSFAPVARPEWSQVTALSTDSAGNTSEFALNRTLTPDPLKITAYSEPVPPVRGALSVPSESPAMQVVVISPPNSLGDVDSIGPTFNTFGTRATYDPLTDHNSGGLPDTRVEIASPDTGEYQIKYILIGDPGNYLTGIGVDGHAEVKAAVAFAAPGETENATFDLAPPSRGELNGDGVIDVFDVIASIDIVFSGAPMPDPPELVDVNCDGVPDVFDVIYLIDYAFSGGPAPCQ